MSEIKSLSEEIHHWMQKHSSQMINACQELIRIPSQNGIDPEENVAKEVVRIAKNLGFEPRYLSKDVTRPNVVVEIGEGGRSFAFVGHMDTVPAGDPASWKHAPFSGTREDGKIYGRGALDLKSALVVGLYTLRALRDFNLDIGARLLFAAVSDEESGAASPLGTRHLVDAGFFHDTTAAIYMEPSTYLIAIGHRGVMRLTLEVFGEATHTGTMSWQNRKRGANAVTGMARILLALEELKLPYTESPSFSEFVPVLTPGTTITGGTGISIVPDYCKSTVDIRLLPGQTRDSVVSSVDDVCKESLSYDPKLRHQVTVNSFVPAACISAEEPLVTSAKGWVEHFMHRSPRVRSCGPANEGYMLIEQGIPTTCGFGLDGGNVHAPDEFVLEDSFALTGSMYALVALDVLGSKE